MQTPFHTSIHVHTYVRTLVHIHLVNVGLTQACPNKQTACSWMFNAHHKHSSGSLWLVF